MTTPIAKQLRERYARTIEAYGREAADTLSLEAADEIDRLTAAADVGCGIKDPPCTFDEGYRYKEAECKGEINATLERCAQVADTYPGRIGRQIAAKIRKFKE